MYIGGGGGGGGGGGWATGYFISFFLNRIFKNRGRWYEPTI